MMTSITLKSVSLMVEIVVVQMWTNLSASNVNVKKTFHCLMANSMVYAMWLSLMTKSAIQRTTKLNVDLMVVIVSLFKVILQVSFKKSFTICLSLLAHCEYPEKYKDNICDDANNVEKCAFDGDDCCLGDLSQCDVCMCHIQGKYILLCHLENL